MGVSGFCEFSLKLIFYFKARTSLRFFKAIPRFDLFQKLDLELLSGPYKERAQWTKSGFCGIHSNIQIDSAKYTNFVEN